jgi:hypothetical protein
MRSADTATDRPASSHNRLVTKVLIVVLLSGVSIGGWMIYRGISVSLEAEYNLHATIFTIRLVEQFVTEQGRWPSSWEELERLSVPNDRLCWGQAWPNVSAEVQKRVLINFHVDPKEIAAQQPNTFDAIKPIGAYYEYREYPYVRSLQGAVRKSLKN